MATSEQAHGELEEKSGARRSLRRMLLAVATLLCLVGLRIFALPAREPVCQGKPLSAWLERFDEPFATTFLAGFEDVPQPAVDAVRSIGSNALPMLLELIQARDSRAKERLLDLLEKQSVVKFRVTPASVKQRRATLAFCGLGPMALPALPKLKKLLADEHTALPAAIAIAQVGPEGLSVLTNALAGTNPLVRHACSYGLCNIPTNGAAVIPTLIASLKDRDAVVQCKAAEALGLIRDNPTIAIPALLDLLLTTNDCHLSAVNSLGLYGQLATSAVPALLTCLVSDEATTRLWALLALRRIRAETNAIIAKLTEAVTNSDVNLRVFSIQSLTPYRHLASNAVPVLMTGLTDPVAVVRRVATNALVAIAPEVAELYGVKTVAAPGGP